MSDPTPADDHAAHGHADPTPDDVNHRVIFHEGSITLPTGYEDRTTNVFVPANPEQSANLSIARDWLNDGEALPAYIDRQLVVLKQRLPGHRVIHRGIARLGDPNRDDLLVGERIDATHKNGQRLVHQRQAAFLVAPRRALILTGSSPRPFNDAFEAMWLEWLRSFAVRSEVDVQVDAGDPAAASPDDTPT